MDTVVHKIGRRKTSVARIYLKKGKGNFTVNTKDWKKYLQSLNHVVLICRGAEDARQKITSIARERGYEI